jgi:hypothetical protein
MLYGVVYQAVMSGELGKMWEKAVVAYFKTLSQNPLWIEEALSLDGQLLDRGPDLLPLEYEATFDYII